MPGCSWCYASTVLVPSRLRPPVGSIASPGGRSWRLRPVTIEELFDALSAVPGARRTPVSNGNGIVASVVLQRIEIAHAATGDDVALRRSWRSRSRGGALPLLLLGPTAPEEGSVV